MPRNEQKSEQGPRTNPGNNLNNYYLRRARPVILRRRRRRRRCQRRRRRHRPGFTQILTAVATTFHAHIY